MTSRRKRVPPSLSVGVYVQHPIQDRTDEEMREIADKAFDGVLAQILKQD